MRVKGPLPNPVFVFLSETRSRDGQTLRVVDRRVLGRDRRSENGSDTGSSGDVGHRRVDRGRPGHPDVSRYEFSRQRQPRQQTAEYGVQFAVRRGKRFTQIFTFVRISVQAVHV